ncbi:hypothetical protein T03_1545 [Trichinella britovi]|uniref:Uncharacterized protein n=1 Tax=Trichinella britovi TaxID=45882 RepID=A0A0V1CLC9_TRIBR|nr:hypothetical protein T03_1545 [Trichinella britovi]
MCYERNDTDLVRVTQPWAGAQWSRVEHEQCPRTTGQIAILASGGTGLGSARPTAATLIALRFKNVDRLDIIFRSEQDSFDGAPRRPFRAGQQVRELGGIVQLTPFMNTGLELGPKGREFQHLPCKLRESHLRQPPVVAANGALSVRLDHSCARSRFPNSSSSTSVWSASAARKVSSIRETCSSTSKASADPMHNSSTSANSRFNRSLRAMSFLHLVVAADTMVSGIPSNTMLTYKSARRSLVSPMEVDCMRWGGYGCNVLWRMLQSGS